MMSRHENGPRAGRSVTTPAPGPGKSQTLQRRLLRSGTAAGVIHGAHLAAIDRGCLPCPAGDDLHLSHGVQHHHPLDGDAARGPAPASG
jgi:hypothetical protein